MRIEYDEIAQRCYIYFREIGPAEVKQTIGVCGGIYLDFDCDNKLVGIDILADEVPDELVSQADNITETKEN